jgi:carboxypeptidase Q
LWQRVLPVFLRSLNWSYWNYTWHTNRDTYDKIVFDDLRNNVILIATLAYMASEDPETFDREKRVMPPHPRTGQQMNWPEVRSPNRSGGTELN